MIAIKDMEMPNECAYCGFCTNNWKCILLNKRANNIVGYHAKLSDCPLVEIEERKVGKWIYDKASQNWRCSVCNETPKTLGYVGTSAFMKEHFEFCNHCGSEMVGADNG